MPIYEYLCKNCLIKIEQIEIKPKNCPICNECGNKMEKVISAGYFELKGEGYYKEGLN